MLIPFRVGMERRCMLTQRHSVSMPPKYAEAQGGMPTPFRVGMERGRMLTQRHSVSMPPTA
jgi:hypothetical protein